MYFCWLPSDEDASARTPNKVLALWEWLSSSMLYGLAISSNYEDSGESIGIDILEPLVLGGWDLWVRSVKNSYCLRGGWETQRLCRRQQGRRVDGGERARVGWMDTSLCSHPTSPQPSVVTSGFGQGSVCESLLRGQEFVWVNVKWRQKEKKEPLASGPYSPSPRKKYKRQGGERAVYPHKVRNWWEDSSQPLQLWFCSCSEQVGPGTPVATPWSGLVSLF